MAFWEQKSYSELILRAVHSMSDSFCLSGIVRTGRTGTVRANPVERGRVVT
jgi:hypothetical protein